MPGRPGSEKVERVTAVLAGRRPDRPPVGFWYHFDRHRPYGPEAVRAHLDHLGTYDLDFLKVMNDNGYPHPGVVHSVADLATLPVLNGDEPEFARQLELIETLAKEVRGKVLITSTVFNAWATLRRLVKPRFHGAPPLMRASADEASIILSRFLAHDHDVLARALETIGESLARFARRCLEAGADGIFLSVRDDWVDTPTNGPGTYREIVRPTDLQILEAATAGRFNLLHVCGCAVNFESFAAYPVHALNWADRAAGPAIAEVRDRVKPALCSGVDNLGVLVEGTPEQCAAQVRDAIAQAGDRPIMIAPGCTFDPARVPRENLAAVCQAARSAYPEKTCGTGFPAGPTF
ncbi:MAG: uroporphyrinogen decarboxylase family protein [Planctomycetota bacterium]